MGPEEVKKNAYNAPKHRLRLSSVKAQTLEKTSLFFQTMHNVSDLIDIGIMILTSRFFSLGCVMGPLVLLTGDF